MGFVDEHLNNWDIYIYPSLRMTFTQKTTDENKKTHRLYVVEL